MTSKINNKKIYNEIYTNQSKKWRERRWPFYNKLASYIYDTDNVLDLGCGNGILSSLSKWNSYLGIDDSDVGIECAKKICPSANFICEDIFIFLDNNSAYYNTVVMTEFLEHIEEDLLIISKIKNNSKIIISVPNNEILVNGKPKGFPIHRRSYTLDNVTQRYNDISFKELFVFMKWIIGIGIKN